MTAQNYPRCLANTLNEEGGWTNDPHDPGGPTMYGIIQREYTKYRTRKGLANQSVRYITNAELQEIYRGNYWNPVRGDDWPKGPDQIVWDIAVNSGLGRANKIMASALGTNVLNYGQQGALANRSNDKVGIVKRACARRASFYRNLGTFQYFGRGWLARNGRMEAIGVRMAVEAQNVPINPELEKQKAGAAVKSKRAGQGAAGAGTGTAAGGGGLTQLDPSTFDWTAWLLIGVLGVAAIALIIGLIWLWRKHGERAKAYAQAIEGKLELDLEAVIDRFRVLPAKTVTP